MVAVWLNFLVFGSGESVSANQRFLVIAMTSVVVLLGATLPDIATASKPVGIRRARDPLSPSLTFIHTVIRILGIGCSTSPGQYIPVPDFQKSAETTFYLPSKPHPNSCRATTRLTGGTEEYSNSQNTTTLRQIQWSGLGTSITNSTSGGSLGLRTSTYDTSPGRTRPVTLRKVWRSSPNHDSWEFLTVWT